MSSGLRPASGHPSANGFTVSGPLLLSRLQLPPRAPQDPNQPGSTHFPGGPSRNCLDNVIVVKTWPEAIRAELHLCP